MLKIRAFSVAVLIAIGVAGFVTAAMVASASTITLEKAVHFTTPTGEDVVVGPGTLEVEAVKEGLRLKPKEGKPEDAKLIQASTVGHGEPVEATTVVSERLTEDLHHVALFRPDGTGLDARGSYSGIRSRGICDSCVAIGKQALNFMASTHAGGGDLLTAVGYNTLSLNLGGFANTGIGGNALSANTSGVQNTAIGMNALVRNETGNQNTATGVYALQSTLRGDANTAMGVSALKENIIGNYNTAIGISALHWNTSSYNTAAGALALSSNQSGIDNTAVGYKALKANGMGTDNTAIGSQALELNNGFSNTAAGFKALNKNSTGSFNTAMGRESLLNNNGSFNTAIGHQALQSTSGKSNTAVGYQALQLATGSLNTAIGLGAGQNLTTGNSNVYIHHLGVEAEDGTIRIGGANQTRTFIAGIKGVAVSGPPVVVDATTGQLGVAPPSSKRYKTDIHDLGTASDALLKLRPVSFRYKSDAVVGAEARPRDYGLIAEEVAEVYPDLVTYSPSGALETVRYDQLIPMLLNELQQQHRVNEEQQRQITELPKLRAQIEVLTAQLAELKAK